MDREVPSNPVNGLFTLFASKVIAIFVRQSFALANGSFLRLAVRGAEMDSLVRGRDALIILSPVAEKGVDERGETLKSISFESPRFDCVLKLFVKFLVARLLSTNTLLNSLSADISPTDDRFKSSSIRVERVSLLLEAKLLLFDDFKDEFIDPSPIEPEI